MKLDSTPSGTPPQTSPAMSPPARAGAAAATAQPPVRPAWRRTRMLAWSTASGVLLGVMLWGSGFRHAPWPPAPGVPATSGADKATEARQRARLLRYLPQGPFIVVDATHNRLSLRHRDEVILDATCSSGSGMILEEVQGERRWVFDTPRGRFRILNKTRNPVWKKPDWAFVEEGKPIPDDPGERFEAGVLGEYGMYFGDGFLIHGTLYERLLGRSVTHGCIRLGRDDLRRVYEKAHVGTPIYIY